MWICSRFIFLGSKLTLFPKLLYYHCMRNLLVVVCTEFGILFGQLFITLVVFVWLIFFFLCFCLYFCFAIICLASYGQPFCQIHRYLVIVSIQQHFVVCLLFGGAAPNSSNITHNCNNERMKLPSRKNKCTTYCTFQLIEGHAVNY